MHRVLTVEFAILHLFQTTGGIAFFFGRRIVAPFALGAFQNNQFAHFLELSLGVDVNPEPFRWSGPGTLPSESSAALQRQNSHCSGLLIISQ